MQTAQLESHEMFRLLRPEQVNTLSAAAETVAFQAGDTVFRRGDWAEDFFVVLNHRSRFPDMVQAALA